MKSSAGARLSLLSPPPIDERPLPPEVVESGLFEVRGEGVGSIEKKDAERRRGDRERNGIWKTPAKSQWAASLRGRSLRKAA